MIYKAEIIIENLIFFKDYINRETIYSLTKMNFKLFMIESN